MYPNEARLKNFTYAFTIHYDVDIEYTIYLPLDDGSKKYKIETSSNLHKYTKRHLISNIKDVNHPYKLNHTPSAVNLCSLPVLSVE